MLSPINKWFWKRIKSLLQVSFAALSRYRNLSNVSFLAFHSVWGRCYRETPCGICLYFLCFFELAVRCVKPTAVVGWLGLRFGTCNFPRWSTSYGSSCLRSESVLDPSWLRSDFVVCFSCALWVSSGCSPRIQDPEEILAVFIGMLFIGSLSIDYKHITYLLRYKLFRYFSFRT